ncbi:MAG: hypothetical protein LH650_01345, partial [Chloroflexi bacterium]|nr:hypothetical protein [Chloroflexota bacterium]
MTATTATTSGAAIRVGLLTPYFAVFEGRFPPTYRASQALQAGGLAEALRMRGLEVGESGVVDGAQSAAGAAIRGARLEPAGPAG